MEDDRLWWEIYEIRKELMRTKGISFIEAAIGSFILSFLSFYLPYAFLYSKANFYLLTKGNVEITFANVWDGMGIFFLIVGMGFFVHGVTMLVGMPEKWHIHWSRTHPEQYRTEIPYSPPQIEIPPSPQSTRIKRKKVKTTPDGRPIYRKKTVTKKEE